MVNDSHKDELWYCFYVYPPLYLVCWEQPSLEVLDYSYNIS